jgi:hypothetical protein
MKKHLHKANKIRLGKTAMFEQWHSHLVFPGSLRCREAASCKLVWGQRNEKNDFFKKKITFFGSSYLDASGYFYLSLYDDILSK